MVALGECLDACPHVYVRNETPRPPRFEPYLTACLWLGGEVVAAAALRLNLPPPPSSASSSAAASTSSGAGAEGTHLQVGSAPKLLGRGVGGCVVWAVRQCVQCTVFWPTCGRIGHSSQDVAISKAMMLAREACRR